jgi:hypothetical protein
VNYLGFGVLGFVIPVASALVVAFTSHRMEAGNAFFAGLVAGIFNQIPFLGFAFQLNRKIDPWGRKMETGNRSHRKAVVVELLSLIVVNAAVSADIARSILIHNSPFAGADIIILPLVSCVAMALGYLIAYVLAEFLRGLRGEGKKGSKHDTQLPRP